MGSILIEELYELVLKYVEKFGRFESEDVRQVFESFFESYKIEGQLKRMMITPEEAARALFTEIHIKLINKKVEKDVVENKIKIIEGYKKRASDIFGGGN